MYSEWFGGVSLCTISPRLHTYQAKSGVKQLFILPTINNFQPTLYTYFMTNLHLLRQYLYPLSTVPTINKMTEK